VVIAERDCVLVSASPHAAQPIVLNKREVVRLRGAITNQTAMLSYQLQILPAS